LEAAVKSNLEVLGIARQEASAGEIKAAYLKLVKRYHPDRAQGKTPEAAAADEAR
jgi:DnaJ-class molecular chaperone